MTDDAARGRRGEMRAQHQDLVIGIPVEKIVPRVPGAGHVMVVLAGDIRQGALNWMVHQVAGDDGAVAVGRDCHADIAGGVAWRRLQANVLGHLMVHLHQIVQAGFDDRVDGIPVHFRCVEYARGHCDIDITGDRVSGFLAPVCPLGAAKEVARVGEKAGSQLPSTSMAFQPT